MSQEADNKGHEWGLGWEESETPHPGFGGSQNIYGGYVGQCEKCGMYIYEFTGATNNPGKYEGQPCDKKIR
jgi:hypothetical protein